MFVLYAAVQNLDGYHRETLTVNGEKVKLLLLGCLFFTRPRKLFWRPTKWPKIARRYERSAPVLLQQCRRSRSAGPEQGQRDRETSVVREQVGVGRADGAVARTPGISCWCGSGHGFALVACAAGRALLPQSGSRSNATGHG